MTGLTHVADVMAGGYYQRVPEGVRIDRVRGWLRSLGITVPDEFAPALARCESGAEARFLWEFCTRSGVRVMDAEALGLPGNSPLVVFPQYVWDRYRVDFYLTSETRQLAIEIDGFSFHHVTPQQIEDDYARQRRIVAGLCPVMRFTARDVFAGPAGCWRDVDAYFQTPRAA